MILLTVPIFFPIVVGLGFDPVWFGIIVVMVVELGMITPPIGMNVFVIKGHGATYKTVDDLFRCDGICTGADIADHRGVSAAGYCIVAAGDR